MRDLAKASSEVRSLVMARIVDSYTNILTVKLFSKLADEDAYVREAVDEHQEAIARHMRMTSRFMMTLQSLNALLLAGTAVIGLMLWSRGELTAGQVATALENGRLYQQLRLKAAEIDRLRGFGDSIIESLDVGLLVVDRENDALHVLRGVGDGTFEPPVDYPLEGTPTAVTAGISNMARRAVLVKGGIFFELAGKIDALVVDKTGTLTEGKPAVVAVTGPVTKSVTGMPVGRGRFKREIVDADRITAGEHHGTLDDIA